jgi:hypothetical protein
MRNKINPRTGIIETLNKSNKLVSIDTEQKQMTIEQIAEKNIELEFITLEDPIQENNNLEPLVISPPLAPATKKRRGRKK